MPDQEDTQAEQNVDADHPDRRVRGLGADQYRQVVRKVWGQAADDEGGRDKGCVRQRKYRGDVAGCERHPLTPCRGDIGADTG